MTTIVFNKWYGEGDFARLLLRYEGGKALVIRKQNRKGMVPKTVLLKQGMNQWYHWQKFFPQGVEPQWYKVTPRSPAAAAEVGEIGEI